jgi:hypothetical protein
MDEYDILLTNEGVGEKMLGLVRKFGGKADEKFEGVNRKR